MRGSYVAGWIKRGPTGFIGTNKSCAAQTVHNLVADYNAGLLADPVQQSRPRWTSSCAAGGPTWSTPQGWQAIDEAEIARGGEHRPRDKFTSVADMLAAAATAPAPPMRDRVLAGLRRCPGERRYGGQCCFIASSISSMLTSRTGWPIDH